MRLTFAGVGKSCLLLRFSDDSFTTSFITTIGYALWEIYVKHHVLATRNYCYLPFDGSDEVFGVHDVDTKWLSDVDMGG